MCRAAVFVEPALRRIWREPKLVQWTPSAQQGCSCMALDLPTHAVRDIVAAEVAKKLKVFPGSGALAGKGKDLCLLRRA